MITTYAQGFALLAVASDKYGYHLDLEAVARIWRGGCIIRAAMLDDIQAAFHSKHDLANLLLDPDLSQKIKENQEYLRQIVCHGKFDGYSHSRAYGFTWLSRCFQQFLVTCQSYSGATRLFWCTHLRTYRCQRYFSHRMAERIIMKMEKSVRITTLFLDIGGVLLSNGWRQKSRTPATKVFKLNFVDVDKDLWIRSIRHEGYVSTTEELASMGLKTD